MDLANFITLSLQRAVYVVLPMIIAANAILLLQLFAKKLNIVDKPSERKSHIGNIPLVGGAATFTAFAISASLLVPQFQVLVFLLLCLCLVLLGLADDMLDLPALLRLFVQAAVAVAMVIYANLHIVDIGNVFGLGDVQFGVTLSMLFTIFCTIGAINSVNMIDGLDGLLGGIISISFVTMGIIAWRGGDWVSAKLLIIFFGATLGFLIFNSRVFFSRAQVFMGDSGSMLLGFVLVWFFIKLTQGDDAPMSPVVAGWIFGLPLADTTSVIIGRLRRGKSVFEAGRDHIHHQLLDSGFSVNAAVIICCLLHLSFALTGLMANGNESLEPLLFWSFAACVCLHHFCTPIAIKYARQIA